ATLLAVAGAAAGAVLGSFLAKALLSANGLAAAAAAGGLAGLRRGATGGIWWLAAVIVVLAIIIMSWPALRPILPGDARSRRGRRPQRQGGPVLLVVLAVATGTLALAQHQSWHQSQLDRAAFATGADVRVNLAAPLTPGRAGALAHAPGVLGAMPVAAFNSGFD